MNDLGLFAAILSPFFSSVATIFKSAAAKSLGPLPVMGIGGILGSVILFAFAKFRKEKISISKIKTNWKDIAGMVSLRFLLGELFFTFGLAQTSAIKAIFFTKIEPYFVLLLSWVILKEKVKPKYLMLLTVHLSGALLLSTGGDLNFFGKAQLGDLFIIIAMFFFASSYIQGKKLSENLGPISSTAISMGIASIIVIPFMFIFSNTAKIFVPSLGLTYLVLYVLFFNVIGLPLWFASLRAVKGWMVSALRYIGPVLGAPVAYLLLKESLNNTQIIGAFIILTTSFLIAVEHIRTSKKEPLTEEL